MQRSSSRGRLPLVLRLIVPFERPARTRFDGARDRDRTQERFAFASLSEGDDPVVDALVDDESRPRRARCAPASSAIRALRRRQPGIGSCSEMQPMQRALHRGDTGSAASPRSKKTFCAVKQPYSTRTVRDLAQHAIAGFARDPSLDDSPRVRLRRIVRGCQSSLSSVRIAATWSRSSTAHANVYPKSGSAGASRCAAYAGSNRRVYPAGSATASAVRPRDGTDRRQRSALRNSISSVPVGCRNQLVERRLAHDPRRRRAERARHRT